MAAGSCSIFRRGIILISIFFFSFSFLIFFILMAREGVQLLPVTATLTLPLHIHLHLVEIHSPPVTDRYFLQGLGPNSLKNLGFKKELPTSPSVLSYWTIFKKIHAMHASEQALESFIWFKIIFTCRIKIRIIKNTEWICSDHRLFGDQVFAHNSHPWREINFQKAWNIWYKTCKRQ